MDTRDAEIGQWAWGRLALLVAGLSAVLGDHGAGGWMVRAVWRAALARVRLAESLARRLVVLAALDLPVPAPKRAGALRPVRDVGQGAEPARQKVTARAARLALGDVLPDPFASLCVDGPGAAWPRVDMPGHACTRGLARRLAGLRDVLDAPQRYVRRMAVRMSGARARRAVLRPGRPCGLPRDIYDLDGGALDAAHELCLSRLNRPP